MGIENDAEWRAHEQNVVDSAWIADQVHDGSWMEIELWIEDGPEVLAKYQHAWLDCVVVDKLDCESESICGFGKSNGTTVAVVVSDQHSI